MDCTYYKGFFLFMYLNFLEHDEEQEIIDFIKLNDEWFLGEFKDLCDNGGSIYANYYLALYETNWKRTIPLPEEFAKPFNLEYTGVLYKRGPIDRIKVLNRKF
jgi:hypothetical protein